MQLTLAGIRVPVRAAHGLGRGHARRGTHAASSLSLAQGSEAALATAIWGGGPVTAASAPPPPGETHSPSTHRRALGAPPGSPAQGRRPWPPARRRCRTWSRRCRTRGRTRPDTPAGTCTRPRRSSQRTLPQTGTAPRGTGTGAGLREHGTQWAHLPSPDAPSPKLHAADLSQGGGGEGRVDREKGQMHKTERRKGQTHDTGGQGHRPEQPRTIA